MKKLEKISRILEYLKHLKSFGIRKVEDLENLEKFYATTQVIFNIINEMIDIAEEICINKGYYPTSYREAFEILKQSNIIDEELFKGLEWLVRIRNIIAHRYSILTKSDIFEACMKIEKIVKEFLDAISSK